MKAQQKKKIFFFNFWKLDEIFAIFRTDCNWVHSFVSPNISSQGQHRFFQLEWFVCFSRINSFKAIIDWAYDVPMPVPMPVPGMHSKKLLHWIRYSRRQYSPFRTTRRSFASKHESKNENIGAIGVNSTCFAFNCLALRLHF